jgi:hypothetical protein
MLSLLLEWLCSERSNVLHILRDRHVVSQFVAGRTLSSRRRAFFIAASGQLQSLPLTTNGTRKTKSAGEFSRQATPHRPGITPALGVRAKDDALIVLQNCFL